MISLTRRQAVALEEILENTDAMQTWEVGYVPREISGEEAQRLVKLYGSLDNAIARANLRQAIICLQAFHAKTEREHELRNAALAVLHCIAHPLGVSPERQD